MIILTEGDNAANLPSPKNLQECLEFDEKTRRKMLFGMPFLIVLSSDGKFKRKTILFMSFDHII